jgi:hypothetical protein
MSFDEEISFDKTETAVSKELQKPSYLINQTRPSINEWPASLYSTVIIEDNNSTFQLDGPSWDRLDRFQTRTVLTIGTPRGARLYQDITLKFAFMARVCRALSR